MMMNLMTVLVKKVFISSKPSIVCLLCPPPCGPFSIQESAVGGLSYKVKKNVPWHILAPRRGCFSNHLPLRRVRILSGAFLSYGNEVSYTMKKSSRTGKDSFPIRLFLFLCIMYVLTLQRPLRLWRRLLSIAVPAQTLRFRSFRLLYR